MLRPVYADKFGTVDCRHSFGRNRLQTRSRVRGMFLVILRGQSYGEYAHIEADANLASPLNAMRSAIKARRTILISGRTSTGKTPTGTGRILRQCSVSRTQKRRESVLEIRKRVTKDPLQFLQRSHAAICRKAAKHRCQRQGERRDKPCLRRRSRPTLRGRRRESPRRSRARTATCPVRPCDQNGLAAGARAELLGGGCRFLIGAYAAVRGGLRFVVGRCDGRGASVSLKMGNLGIDQERRRAPSGAGERAHHGVGDRALG